MLIDNGTRVRLVIPGVFDGVAGRDASGELAFVTDRPRSGEKAATIDGEEVKVRLDRSRHDSRTHPFLYATVIG